MADPSRSPDVLLVGPLSGTLTGAVAATSAVRDRLSDQFSLATSDVAPAGLDRSLRYHSRRVLRYAQATWKVATTRAPTVVLVAEGGKGVLYALPLAAIGRIRKRSFLVHHHSFSYLNQHSALVRAFVVLLSRRSAHIFLCECMRDTFAALYGLKGHRLVVSNAALLGPDLDSRTSPAHERFTIGHLSNLSAAKGLDAVLALSRSLQRDEVATTIAGPPPPQATLAAQLVPPINYLGPVYDEAKRDFLSTLDAFMFPTRYANEAEPLVVLEALAAGVPVLATRRGCLTSVLPADWLFEEGEFETDAAAVIRHWSTTPIDHQRAQREAQARYEALRDQGSEGLSHLLQAIARNSSKGARPRRGTSSV